MTEIPAGPTARRPSRRPVIVYTALRVAVFGLVFVVLWLFGIDVFPAMLVAVVISGALSYVLLRRQREALTATVAERLEGGRRKRVSREQMPTPEDVARVTGRGMRVDPEAKQTPPG